jgi:hypothetical protein
MSSAHQSETQHHAHPRVVPLRTAVRVASVQGTLALDLAPTFDPPPADVVPLDRPTRDRLEQWSRRYVQAAVEIVGGDRPVSQLLRWTTPSVYQDLARRALLVARAAGQQPGQGRVQTVRPQVLGVRASFVTDAAAEVSAHVRYGARSRAVAGRFELRQGRWLCVALEFA